MKLQSVWHYELIAVNKKQHAALALRHQGVRQYQDGLGRLLGSFPDNRNRAHRRRGGPGTPRAAKAAPASVDQ